MTNERFQANYTGDDLVSVHDTYNDNKLIRTPDMVCLLNDQQKIIDEKFESITLFITENTELKKENKRLKELLTLIADIDTLFDEDNVKDLIRHHLRGLDSISYESSCAWNDYVLLNNFYKEHYGEKWE